MVKSQENTIIIHSSSSFWMFLVPTMEPFIPQKVNSSIMETINYILCANKCSILILHRTRIMYVPMTIINTFQVVYGLLLT